MVKVSHRYLQDQGRYQHQDHCEGTDQYFTAPGLVGPHTVYGVPHLLGKMPGHDENKNHLKERLTKNNRINPSQILFFSR
jgi:hypothetical protein